MDRPPRRSFGTRIVLWSLWWLVVIGGTGALFNLASIKDDYRRADLAERGGRTTGILSNGYGVVGVRHWRGCGKGSHAVLQFTPENKPLRGECLSEELPPEYRYFVYDRSAPALRVIVVYDPKNGSHFFVAAPDGTVPRRNLVGIWHRWLMQTSVLFSLYMLVTCSILWRQHRARVRRHTEVLSGRS